MHDEAFVANLLDSIADGRAERLASSAAVRCWPGGGTDRTDPVAVEWLRRWGPGARGGIDLPQSRN
jgi:hypothetical protein